jgi:hypothetical protein
VTLCNPLIRTRVFLLFCGSSTCDVPRSGVFLVSFLWILTLSWNFCRWRGGLLLGMEQVRPGRYLLTLFFHRWSGRTCCGIYFLLLLEACSDIWTWTAGSRRLDGQKCTLHCSCGRVPPTECVMWLVAHISARRVSYVNPSEEGTARSWHFC